MQTQIIARASSVHSSYCVIASVRAATLSRLEEALSVMMPLSVVVTEATAWGHGRVLSYRGVSVRVQERLMRVEIACEERQVDWIVSAIQRVLRESGSPSSSPERVMALPVHVASAV